MTDAEPGLDASRLATLSADALDDVLRAFADAHGAAALPALGELAADADVRSVRRGAKRALYRLAQRGVAAPPAPPARPIVERRAERAVRAWVSGIDGSGSRAAWILFEGAYGTTTLCSLILNDTVGVLDAAGGRITKKRLDAELAALRASQKLPWVEIEPARAVGLVVEALGLHRARGTAPPEAFARWEPLFAAAAPPPAPVLAAPEPALVERAAELLELPELAGWFLDPESVQGDAVEREAARQSRLVVSDQIKTEREEAILAHVVERELGPDARARWVRRLAEMALVFDAAGRPESAALARAAAAGLAAPDAAPARHPLARGLARRALDLATEVAAGRIPAADVRRTPTPSRDERSQSE
ncbi:MAG: hypothetical protein A3F92_06775 [Candidatus Rokubacteria bacterium RIFCSPLOWO2_12_FULL_71_22]|nr:MAG: hypothetical protein A3F92_06775 [Candidatus Rokubacteria bacterium RIFCSPLOWO2_12_FULL_71_22]